MKSSKIDSCQILIKRILIDTPTAQTNGNQNAYDAVNTFKLIKFVMRHAFSLFEAALNKKYKTGMRLFNLDKTVTSMFNQAYHLHICCKQKFRKIQCITNHYLCYFIKVNKSA